MTPASAVAAPPIAHDSLPARVQRSPDVGFDFVSLEAKAGKLGEPVQTPPGTVTWPLDFAVDAPMSVEAKVRVTGAAGDDCTAWTVGFMQMVHAQSLEQIYTGVRAEDGTSTVTWTVDLSIRDAAPGSMWYEPSSNASPSGCNQQLEVQTGDYPTIQLMPKSRTNTRTGRENYLRAVRRTMGFVTTLVASDGSEVVPLRFFLWSYNMAIGFDADPSDVDGEWKYDWITNSARMLPHHAGTDATVPLETSGNRYNASLTSAVTETG